MTAEPINPNPAPQRIQGPAPVRDTSLDVLPFCWDYWTTDDTGQPEVVYDDTLLTAHRPKQAVLLRAASVLALIDDGTDDFDPEVANQLYDFLTVMLDEPSAAYVRERLEDPEDGRDIDPDLSALLSSLVGRWYGGRAPKAPAVSQRPRSTTGKRSTGRSRSTGSTQKR